MSDTDITSHIEPVEFDLRKAQQLWEGLRIIVIDLETTQPPAGKGSQRVVSMGAVTCMHRTVRDSWYRVIDPGFPIDAITQKVHGLTDDHVFGQPTFGEYAHEILALLTPAEGERKVIAGHKVSFDISVLRYELQLVGLDMPDVPLIDTKGALTQLAKVAPAGGSLPDLVAAFRIDGHRHHHALSDAEVTAEALIILLDRVASMGRTSIEDLIVELGGPASAIDVKAGVYIDSTGHTGPRLIPDRHLVLHSTVLHGKNKRDLAKWHKQIAECATTRCNLIGPAVLEADAPANTRLAILDKILTERAAAGDTAGAATVLGAMLPLLAQVHVTGDQRNDRPRILRWVTAHQQMLNDLGRCNEDDRCPDCWERTACPLDVWPDTIAAIAIQQPKVTYKSVLRINGRNAGTGTYIDWRKAGHDPRIGDAALWAGYEALVDDDRKTAEMLATHAFKHGCNHPLLAVMYAQQLAPGNNPADLAAAVTFSDGVLANQNESTAEGWRQLNGLRAHLAGRARRASMTVTIDPATGKRSKDSPHIATRDNVRRRPPRFQRT